MTISDWEARFNRWAQGPSQTEREKCENAERMVKAAITSYPGLRHRNVRVFAQGSYRNRTNVRFDSDVDVCVLSTSTFFPDYSLVPGVTNATLGIVDADYSFPELKHDVEAALVAKFGRQQVTAGDKAFDLNSNTYRVSADVVPSFEGRLYYRNGYGQLVFHSGTVLQSNRTGAIIRNYPEQHYARGVEKHSDTARQFKKKVRIVKNLANEMATSGFQSAQSMASFLLESLVYNCGSSAFSQFTHYAGVEEVIRQTWNATKSDEAGQRLLEVNQIKYLFHPTQPWDRTTANQFLFDAWQYVGFGR